MWVLIYAFNRDPFIALTAVGIAAATMGVSIWAVRDFGTDAFEPLVASSVWRAIALLVAAAQWWADGHSRPIVLEIFHDFRFSHFLTTSFVGLLWALGIAAATVGIFGAVFEYWHQESLLIGLLAGFAFARGCDRLALVGVPVP